MGYGGPHAAYFAATDKLKRSIPGRIIGVSKDSRDATALRMAMQTREQHIRREKATSNICTAQALLANMAGFYAVYHGAEGLTTIATRIHRLTTILAEGLKQKGLALAHDSWFDTLRLTGVDAGKIHGRALTHEINLRYFDNGDIGISLDETTTAHDLDTLFDVLIGEEHGLSVTTLDEQVTAERISGIPAACRRESEFLTHPTFKRYRSETEMLRYLKRLENKDLSLTHAMIPLGSCTMKLNATSEMMPITWPEFGQLHPFVPQDQAVGYKQMIDELAAFLVEITGYDHFSMQPNSGAQGEYAGLVAIRRYQAAQGERSEEHTSELQSRPHLVCRLLLEKKKKTKNILILSHQIILDNMHICTMFNETITLDTSQLHQLNHLLLTSLLFNLIKSNISQDIK